MCLSPVVAASAASPVLLVAACGSDKTSASTSSTSSMSSVSTPAVAPVATSGPEPAPAASTCPTAAPQNAGTPEWTLSGTTGSVAGTGSTYARAPAVTGPVPCSGTQPQLYQIK